MKDWAKQGSLGLTQIGQKISNNRHGGRCWGPTCKYLYGENLIETLAFAEGSINIKNTKDSIYANATFAIIFSIKKK
jgi:hypothetical protein